MERSDAVLSVDIYLYNTGQPRKQGIRTRFSEMFDGEKRAEL